MINYVLDYLQERGVCACSQREQTQLEAGILRFLQENGIRPDETRQYHRSYIRKHLSKVEPGDLKQYFMQYPLLSEVNQVVIEVRSSNTVTQEQRNRLYHLMECLHESGLGEKYIPVIEVKQILGRFA